MRTDLIHSTSTSLLHSILSRLSLHLQQYILPLTVIKYTFNYICHHFKFYSCTLWIPRKKCILESRSYLPTSSKGCRVLVTGNKSLSTLCIGIYYIHVYQNWSFQQVALLYVLQPSDFPAHIHWLTSISIHSHMTARSEILTNMLQLLIKFVPHKVPHRHYWPSSL